MKAPILISCCAVVVLAAQLGLAKLDLLGSPLPAGVAAGVHLAVALLTALAYSVGNLYLAHAMGRARACRGRLLAVWLATVTAAAVLTVPATASLIAGESLRGALAGSGALRWGWAALAAIGQELVAAGCLWAAVTLRAEQEDREADTDRLFAVARERDEALARLAEMEEGGGGGSETRCPWCTYEGANGWARSAHMKHCPSRPDRPQAALFAG